MNEHRQEPYFEARSRSKQHRAYPPEQQIIHAPQDYLAEGKHQARVAQNGHLQQVSYA